MIHTPYSLWDEIDADQAVQNAGITPDWMCETPGCGMARAGERFCQRHRRKEER